MNIGAVITVFKKEVLDIIRDRRTLIFMIVLPLVLLPFIMYMISSFQINSRKSIAAKSSDIAIIGIEDAPGLVDFLVNQKKAKYEAPADTDEQITEFLIENRSEVNAFINARTDIESLEQAQQMIRNKELHAALVIPPGFENMLKGRVDDAVEGEGRMKYDSGLTLRIEFLSTDDNSEKAYDRLQDSLEAYSNRVIDDRLAVAGYDESLIKPWSSERADLATEQEKFGEILGTILPYFIILMTFGGATFPAIQLGAGEKEQKTLETLLSSAVNRADMVAGKFLTIVVTGIISASLSLVGMWYSFSFLGSSAGLKNLFTLQLDVTSMILALLLVIPMALVFAGILLTLSVLAKSYREAQSYIGPLNILVILPAFASFLPGVELNYMLSMVPIVNVSLVLRQILSGKAMEILPYYGVTIASTLVLAGIAIAFCAHMFSKESTVFKD